MVSGLGGKIKSSGVESGKAKQMEEYTEEYVDLGLPSGTLWKAENENCGLINYDKATNFYGTSLPTKAQWEELNNHCIWAWQGNGCKVKGKNGKSIFLPAAGYRDCKGSTYDVGKFGRYWTSTPYDSKSAWGLGFYLDDVYMFDYERCYSRSVRLVK